MRLLRWIRDRLLGRNAWRVIYPNGQRTYRLRYSDACTSAEVFGGRVQYDPEEP